MGGHLGNHLNRRVNQGMKSLLDFLEIFSNGKTNGFHRDRRHGLGVTRHKFYCQSKFVEHRAKSGARLKRPARTRESLRQRPRALHTHFSCP